MDLESLRIFCVVAAELSITHASTRLGRAASNVTTRIQQLEADVGVHLFVRTGKRIALSVAGERFLDYAQRMLALEAEARHVVTGGADGGVLHIGCMESTAASRLPSLLAAYHKRLPGTELAISTGPSRTLVENVRSGKLDCAFVALPPALMLADTLSELGLSTQTIWQEDLVFLLPEGDINTLTPRQVRTRSLAAFKPGCTYRAMAEELLGIAGSTTWKIQEMGSYHAMIACVAAGACVAFLPRSVLALSKTPDGVKILEARCVDTHLVWRTGYNVPAFANLLEQIERTCHESHNPWAQPPEEPIH